MENTARQSSTSGPSSATSMPQTFDKIPDVELKSSSQNGAPSGSSEQASSVKVSRDGVLRNRAVEGETNASPPACSLPPEKVFSIQLGSELFRLSGASIASDAPSYFSQFFEEQLRQTESGGNVRTLYIDRDPATFREICRHLQGYHIHPRDGMEYVKLFADAQFYSLPRLVSRLFESEICIQIGDRDFQVSRDIFSGPGDSPNFFNLGFAILFATPTDVFPGLQRSGLLRPPSIIPPSVPGRSGAIFAQLIHLLRGYPVHIQNESHRLELLRDCRYYHLRGVEQRLIPHHISYNPGRERDEILIRLNDIRQSGIQVVSDGSSPDASTFAGWVHYARPFVDDNVYELVIEIGGQSTIIDLNTMRAEFHGLAKARVSSLVQVIANKLNLPNKAPLGLMMMAGASKTSASPGNSPLSEDRPKIRIDKDADITVDNEAYVPGNDAFGSPIADADLAGEEPPAKRKRKDVAVERGQWMVHNGQWRLRVQPDSSRQLEIVFHAVKLDVYTSQRVRNRKRAFLG
ncbi:hypothetical protein BGW36DRAFT_396762 [Talaromyces proteolyticus]|uniref:Potassium channel tetramerisation-type BTB domain-containing protein n=1 Tax=Talaromyces proteolyticus TaxID=1131652 RepID=A0AAD4Q234_9EURO|nr:uncharacterized protein BGW36DRAFT_396762 [Talaromyces proteolyticus]KAH8699208.1 hypothetical protein BGW36DRAFT_396762 [Talaromyces proteolyticus]